MTGTVLEEGLRGAGGHLLNGAMHRFMGDYDDKLERATRDVVSRAIDAEMRAGRTTPHGGVYIKMSHLGPAKVAKEFKGMVDRCRDCGFDLAGGLVEVVPTAHYFMGGVVCGADTSTEWPGLFVAGEDASGMHGANRLGGNGVANSTVFGGIAGDVMPRWIAANPGHRRAGRGRAGCGARPRAGAVRAQRREPERAARKAARYHVGRRRRRARPGGARSRHRGARRHRGRASGDRRGRRRPRLQPDLARLAQSALAHRDQPGHCARRAQAREFARRPFPFRLPGTGRLGDIVVHGCAADRRRASRSPSSRSSSPMSKPGETLLRRGEAARPSRARRT